jgi:hypothetical protein
VQLQIERFQLLNPLVFYLYPPLQDF